jgi:hypothetical protein
VLGQAGPVEPVGGLAGAPLGRRGATEGRNRLWPTASMFCAEPPFWPSAALGVPVTAAPTSVRDRATTNLRDLGARRTSASVPGWLDVGGLGAGVLPDPADQVGDIGGRLL